jgi:hypothetical protein
MVSPNRRSSFRSRIRHVRRQPDKYGLGRGDARQRLTNAFCCGRIGVEIACSEALDSWATSSSDRLGYAAVPLFFARSIRQSMPARPGSPCQIPKFGAGRRANRDAPSRQEVLGCSGKVYRKPTRQDLACQQEDCRAHQGMICSQYCSSRTPDYSTKSHCSLRDHDYCGV